MDAMELSRLYSTTKDPSLEFYSDEIVDSIKIVGFLDELAMNKLTTIVSPSNHVTIKVSVIEGQKNHTGFGEVIVDATIEEVAAIEYSVTVDLLNKFT